VSIQPAEADKAVALTEHQGITDDKEPQRRHTEVQEVLGQYITGILGTNKAGFDHAEAGLHEEHQKRRNQDPNGVQTLLDIGDRDHLVRRIHLPRCREQKTTTQYTNHPTELDRSHIRSFLNILSKTHCPIRDTLSLPHPHASTEQLQELCQPLNVPQKHR
jgi:hypothetical protein